MYGVDGQIRIDSKNFNLKNSLKQHFVPLKKQFKILISIKADVGC